MSILMVLKILSAVATIVTGLLALVKPSAIYGFIGLNATDVRGVSEIRAIFGGLFIALGAAPLFLGSVAYQVLGIGYLAIAVVRAFSIGWAIFSMLGCSRGDSVNLDAALTPAQRCAGF